jgi:hypothetical protein
VITQRRKLLCLAAVLLLAGHSAVRASVIYLYDFPGDPGSGLASDQTNSQPSGATFSDFTRTNVGTSGGPLFNSNNWNQGGSIDTTQYVGFSITADAAFALDLTSLTFDTKRTNTGPLNAQVALFLNGSATAYAAFGFSPSTSLSPVTFDFTDLTDADNVTLAEFRLYGWNATGSGGGLGFDNVATNGGVAAVPEIPVLAPTVLLLVCAVSEARKKRRRRSVSALTAIAL